MIRRIIKSIKFIKWYSKDLKIGFSLHDYYCNVETNRIVIPLFERKLDILLWYHFLYKKYDKFKPQYPEVISILHEIGHIETLDIDKQFQKIMLLEKYQEKVDNNEMTSLEFTMKYFNTPLEKKATDWAVEFYRKNNIDKWK